MEDALSGIDAVGSVSNVQLEDVMSSVAQNAEADQAISMAMQDAINRATVLPGDVAARPNAYEELADGISGRGAAIRTEIESQVERAGAEPRKHEEDAEGIEAVGESLTSLMREMTTWQVTWGMAQTAQKDVSHVLKSG